MGGAEIVDVFGDDAGLHTQCEIFFVELDDLVHFVDHQHDAALHRDDAAGASAAGATADHGDFVGVGVFHEGGDFGGCVGLADEVRRFVRIEGFRRGVVAVAEAVDRLVEHALFAKDLTQRLEMYFFIFDHRKCSFLSIESLFGVSYYSTLLEN